MRKAQIEMGESIAVIFVFIIMVVIGFVFYARYQGQSMQTQQAEASELRAVEIAHKVTLLAELRCSSENIPDYNCIDKMKVMKFAEIVQENPLFYYDELRSSWIQVEQIFPEPKQGDFPMVDAIDSVFYSVAQGGISLNVTLYNNEPDNWHILEWTQIPTLLLNPLEGKGVYYFGVIYVGVYK